MRCLALIAIPLAAGACAPVEDDREFISEAPPATVVGEPRSCLNTANIRRSTVHDDRTIDFEYTGGKIYRNTLTRGCTRLGFEEAFTYRTSINQLCRNEIIYVLDNVGGELRRGAGCSLNDFVPIEYIDRDLDIMD